MRALPALTLTTAVLLVGFVTWRGAGSHAEVGSAGPTGPAVEIAAAVGPVDPDVEAASKALVEADGPASPTQARALRTAIEKLDLLLERDRTQPDFLFYRGIAAALASDEEGTKSFVARLATASPLRQRDARCVYLKALQILTFDARRPDPALKLLRLLKSEAPTFLPEPVDRALHRALMQASVTRSAPHQGDEAVAFMEEAVKLVRNDPRRLPMTRRMLAMTYARANRFPEAEEIWRAIVEATEGKNVDFVSGLANVLAAQNRWEDAIPWFTRTLELAAAGAPSGDAGVQEARLRRGNCYRMLGHLDEAKADLERYVADRPADHRGQYWLGMLWFDGYDDPEKALPYLEAARRAAPWCDTYGRTLLQLYATRLPDPARAEALKRDMETHEKEYRKKLEALAAESRDGLTLCR